MRSLTRQVARLHRRVAALERASVGTPHAQSETQDVCEESDSTFDREEYSKWTKAMKEYSDLDSLDWFRRHPDLLAERLREERKRNAFLRTRGIVKMLDDRYTRLAARLDKEKRLGK